jgi:hypothetical protein
MTLTEKYKSLKAFEPYFKTFMSYYYSPSGEPKIIEIMEGYLSDENHKIFRKNVLLQHKELIKLNHSILELHKLNINNIKIYLDNFYNKQ